MSDSANTTPPPSAARAARPATRARPRHYGLALAAASPALLTGVALMASDDSLALTLAGVAFCCAAVIAAFASLAALRARERKAQGDPVAHHRALADGLCAAHGRRSARCDDPAGEAAASRNSWQAMFASAPHIAIIATDARGIITACNPGAERLLQTNATAMVGRVSILEFHLASELADRRAPARAPSGNPVSDFATWSAPAHRDERESVPWTWCRADGSTRRVALAVSRECDATGATTGYLAIAHDITAETLAGERMQALQLATRALLDAHTLADVLPKILQAVGSTLTWEFARWWFAEKPGGALRASRHWRAPATATDATAGDTAALVAQAAADGEVRWQPLPADSATAASRALFLVPLHVGRTARGVLEVSGRLHTGSGADLGAMLATLAACVGQFLERKETEKRLFEAESAVSGAVRAKSDFLALMSHEIRTPMNGVIGMSNLLLETQLTPKQRDFAQTIRSSGDSLLTVINDILDFSKLEAGKLVFDKVDFDLRSVVDDTLELMAGNAHAKHLELAAHVHADVPCFVHGDPNRLRQVLNNLVANAIKFTTQGEVILTVARETTTEQRVVLHFAIRDTGIGISPDVQKRLFQPFMQADTSTTRRYGGTGLGLAISRTLVEMMHGHIGVVSEEGKGATFHFTIRFDRAREAGLELPLRTITPAGARVLVVEDNAAHAAILGQQLKAWGLRATRASNAEAALRHVGEAATAAEPFALALLDAELPGAAGTQLAHTLQAHVSTAAPRIILLAGIGQQFDDEELRAAGAAAWVTKPVRESRLYDAVAAVLGGRASARPTALRFPGWPPVSAPATFAASGPARILLVEDNIINQQVALQLLARMGFAADVAINGLEALAALRRAPYEVVLMDCMMPHLDGYETTRRIREVERRRAALGIARPQVHIIALTANSSAEDRARCLAAGMNGFVTKPLRPAELQHLLEQWRAHASAFCSVTSDTNGVANAPARAG